MNNREYWKERFLQLEQVQHQLGEKTLKEIEKLYRKAQKELDIQIILWFQSFADSNSITMQNARKLLAKNELKDFKQTVRDYIKQGQKNAVSGRWIKELENVSDRCRIPKIMSLRIHTRQIFEELFAKQHQIMTSSMGDVYESGYLHTAYEIQKGSDTGQSITKPDRSKIEKILSKPWAADGYNFSERILRNKNKLIREVHNELLLCILAGRELQNAMDNIARKMNTSKHNAGRLVMTEEAYFSSLAQGECFRALEVEEYEILSAPDIRTSKLCKSLDGKRFAMTEFQPGVTAPPFHPNCRTTAMPWFEGCGKPE